jgi:acetate---CoA ligase (ADP-forming)
VEPAAGTTTLAPLLEPRSIAVVGASGRPGRPGHAVVAALRAAGFAGPVYPITPTYDAVEGWPCLPDAAALPEPVDLAVIAGAAPRVPEQLAAAVAAGARSAFVLANVAVPDDVRRAAAGVPLLGPNSLGYVNLARGTAVTWTPPAVLRPGPVAIVSQSGSTYSYATNLDPRLGFSFVAHPGQELAVGAADLIRYAAGLDETRVVGIYLESAGDGPAIAAALRDAAERDVPVVAIRPGRSERSRRQIETHSGRLAGTDAAFEAVFRAYDVARAATVDEWWATLALHAAPRRPRAGGLGAILCSGGARALLLDDAADLGVPLAEVGAGTTARLAELLGPTLPAENPADVWDGQEDLATHATACLQALAEDPAVGLALAFTDYGVHDDARFPQSFAAACTAVAATSDAPVAAATYTSRQFAPAVVCQLAASGVPVLDGMRNAVAAAGHVLRYRDARARRDAPDPVPAVDATALRERLARAGALPEAEALALLGELGVPVPALHAADSADAAVAAAERIGFPVVLKTAGAAHKSDADGVRLGLRDAAAVRDAYADVTGRLGPEVVVAAQAPAGVEVAVGVVQDPAFGPVLVVAAGGTLVELLDDRRALLAPVGPAAVERALRGLRLARLLGGARGAAPCDVGALAGAISRISAIAAAAGPALAGLDVNPIIAHAAGCTAVDALVVGGGTA